MNMKSSGLKAALLCGGALAIAVGGVQAQETTTLDEIVVTGSRIARTNVSSPTPVTVIDSAALALSGQDNVSDVLRELPSAGVSTFSSTTGNFDVNNSGVNTIDLRNLGEARTLVLVNGRRMVSGVPGSSAVDFNSIPTAFVERVEVITGGASAVYGADAVAGVVNIILKDNFQGMQIEGKAGISDRGDSEQYRVSSTVGGNFDDGRGNVVLSLTYDKEEEVFSRDRKLSAVDIQRNPANGAVTNPAYSSFGPGGFFSGIRNNATGTYVGNTANRVVLPDGTISPLNSVRDGYNRNGARYIQTPTERYLLGLNANYEITPSIKYFLEGTYSSVKTESQLEAFALANTDIYASGEGMPLTNPYIPAALLQQIRALAPAGQTVTGLNFSRRLLEVADRGADNTRQTFRFSTGFKGDIPVAEGWSYETSYTYGRTTQAQTSSGQINEQSFRNALDAIVDVDDLNGNGNRTEIVCRDATARANGCVPINIFGAGSITKAAADYVRADAMRKAEIDQHVATAIVTGPIAELPAGSLGVALGGEWRQENSEARADPLSRAGLNAGNATPDVVGKFDVWEAFAEVDVPLIKDVPFAQYVGVQGAIRYSDYSTVGKTTSWNAGAEWQMIDDIRLRGKYARAVRAPNISELFNPGGQTFPTGIVDICSGTTATSSRAQDSRCRADAGIASRIASEGVYTPTQLEIQQITGFNRGNPDLQEERADTFTIGTVLTPSFIDNLSLTVDYFDIDIKDAISGVPRNYAIQQCYVSGEFCNLMSRDPLSGRITRIDLVQGNIATQTTSGIDVALDYRFDLADVGLDFNAFGTGEPGTISLSTVMTYLRKLEIQPLPGAEVDIDDGEVGASKYRVSGALTYHGGPMTFSWQTRYVGPANIDNDLDIVGPGKFRRIGSVFYHDVQARYTFADNYTLYVGVENLFDRDAPLIGSGMPGNTTGSETAAGTYDPIGRYFYTGFTLRF